MNGRTIAAVGLVICIVVLALRLRTPDGETPSPKPDPVTPIPTPPAELFGLDKTLPGTIPDENDRRALGTLCQRFAVTVRMDGDEDEPVLMTSADVGQRFSKAVVFMLERHNISRQYPEAVNAISSVIGEEVATDPDNAVDLTPELRETTAAIFEAAGYVLLYDKGPADE